MLGRLANWETVEGVCRCPISSTWVLLDATWFREDVDAWGLCAERLNNEKADVVRECVGGVDAGWPGAIVALCLLVVLNISGGASTGAGW